MKNQLASAILLLFLTAGLNATYQGSWLHFFDQIRNACDAGPELEELIKIGLQHERFNESFNNRYNTREKKIAYNYRTEKKLLSTLTKDQIDITNREIASGISKKPVFLAKGGLQTSLCAATIAALCYFHRLCYRESSKKEFWALSVGSIVSLLGSYLVPKNLHWHILSEFSKSADKSSSKTVVITKDSDTQYTAREKPDEVLVIMQIALFWGKLLRWSLDSGYNGIQNLKRGIWYQHYLAQKQTALQQMQEIIKQGCHEEQLADIEA